MDLINSPEQLAGWLPIRVNWQGPEPLIDWCLVGDCRFTEPFFDHTIERLLQKPFNLMFRRLTSIDALELAATRLPSLAPSGFIFHMSRCGSTLVSRMLASLPQNVVISEASTLDWMIRANVRRPGITDEERIDWIRWMVASLAQKRDADGRHFFIKFDSWHTVYFDLIQRAFPDVPWIFLYRHPTEVLVSHSSQRGAGTIPGVVEHRIDGMSLQDAVNFPHEQYPAIVLAEICKAALKQSSNPNGMFVNYSKLPDFVSSGLLRHFRLDYSADDISKMKAAARYNAKNPAIEFASDIDEKQREASAEIHSFSGQFLMPIYAELEAVSKINAPADVSTTAPRSAQ